MHRHIKFASRKLEKVRSEIVAGVNRGFWTLARDLEALFRG